jgi:hypothetical protein
MKKRIKSKAGSVADVRHDFNEQASQSVAEFMYLPCMWDLMDKYPEDFPVGKFVKMVPALGGLSSGGLSSGGVKCWVSEIEYARKEHVAECVPTFLDVFKSPFQIRTKT